MPTENSFYESLNQENRQIRVLSLFPGKWDDHLQCSIQTVSLDEDPLYDALSYVWGDPNKTKPMIVENYEVQITANLESALRYLRKPDSALRIWVDAVCINQNDNTEKSYQVGMMGSIYRKCQCAYLWLGSPAMILDVQDSTADRKEVDPFSVIRHFTEDKHYYELPCYIRTDSGSGENYEYVSSPTFDALWAGFCDVALSPWWTRMWTIQETVLPPKAIFRYGDWHMDWPDFVPARLNRLKHMWGCCDDSERRFPPQLNSTLGELFVTINYLAGVRMNQDPSVETYTLNSLTNLFTLRQCSDDRDKVFSLLSLVDPMHWSGFVPDYTLNTAGVYASAVRGMVTEMGGSLRALTGILHTSPRSSGILPSWVRDYASPIKDIHLAQRERLRTEQYLLYDACKSVMAQPKYPQPNMIQLRGVMVDEISLVGAAGKGAKPQELNAVLPSWLRLADLPVDARKSYVDTTTTRIQAFYRTILGDVMRRWRGDKTLGWRRLEPSDIPDFSDLESVEEDLTKEHDSWVQSPMFAAMLGRAFFITTKGYMGLCHGGLKSGDQVWVLHGGNLPFMLRPQDTASDNSAGIKKFELIGSCFVHGIMSGEAMDDPNLRQSEVILE